MKKICILIAMMALVYADMVAQNSFEMNGTVVEKATGEAVVAATIQLLTLPDSNFVKGTTTGEQGQFELKGVKKGNYTMRISYIGLETKYVDVDLIAQKKRNFNIGYITMTEDAVLLKVTQPARSCCSREEMSGFLLPNPYFFPPSTLPQP